MMIRDGRGPAPIRRMSVQMKSYESWARKLRNITRAMTDLSIAKRVSFLTAVLLSALARPVLHAQGASRYEAVLFDGTRLRGDKVSGWHEHPASPRLDNTALFDAKRPLRWLRDDRLKAWRPGEGCPGYIEFVGGDRLVGRIAGVQQADVIDGVHVPAHLQVKPAAPLHDPAGGSPQYVRVLPQRIQRVVFRPASLRLLEGGTVFYLDGRRLVFVGLRWKEDSVVLLLKGGTCEVKLSEVAEVHLPGIDPWQAYYHELAVLSPRCRSRLMRIETPRGLIATGSDLRFGAAPYATAEHTRQAMGPVKRLDEQIARMRNELKARVDQATAQWANRLKAIEQAISQRGALPGAVGTSGTWYHILQPVWSLDPLWVPFRSIYTWWSFAPEQVSLCRVPPASTVNPPLLPVYTNRNSAGELLRSGGRQYAWGFAVHAYSELRFPLPKCARAFHSHIGLDHIVGPGGCARARVHVGSTGGKPAYEGPLLVGSKKTVETGRVALDLPPDGPRQLILQADPASRDSPPGADPLNIRDKLDWLDPWLELDTAALQDQVRGQVGPLIAASQGWTLSLDRRGVYTWTSRLDEAGGSGGRRFLTMLRAQGQPLRLSRRMKIGPTDKWLAVNVGLPTGENPRPDVVALRVGRRKVQPRKVPIRQLWQSRPAPLVFPLAGHQGKKITLELTQPAGGKPLHWQAVSTLAVPPAAYRLVDIMTLVGKSDMQVPYELGVALQSDRISKQEKLAALEINQLGGMVNFRPGLTADVPLDTLANILVDKDWTGGDKTFIRTFAMFKRMSSLRTLLVTEDSRISDGAIAKLRAEMPKLTITRIVKRIPSLEGGKDCYVTWRNLTGKEVLVLYINPSGKLQGSRYLKPGQELKRKTRVGWSYEAHYLRWDHRQVSKYAPLPPLATHVVTPDAVWDIRPWGE